VSTDCREIRELLDSYLSEELSVETNHAVLHHLATCPACADEVRRRQRVRRLLAHSLDVTVDVDRVTQRITQALDRHQHTWRRTVRWGTIAAMLVAGVVAALWLSRPTDVAAYEDSAGNHIACALAIPASATYDADRAAHHLVPPYKAVADAIGHTHGPYHVIDAHMCPYKGRDYVHVVLRGDGRTVSLFAERASRGALPTTPETTTLASDGRQVHLTTQWGYRVTATTTPDFRLFVVSDQPTDSPDAVTNGLLLSAVRFVRTLEN
jgi:Putative zinc-finger